MEDKLPIIADWFIQYSGKIIAALLIFIIGRWLAIRLSSMFSKILEKNKVEITLVSFLKNIIYYALLIAVLIAALNQLGINTASFLTVVGAAGLAIGLALKDSLSNFSSGVMLILFRPFKIGDFVTAAGVSGTVNQISIFNTEMATPDNQKIIIPNSAIMGGVITNVTANPTRRIDLVAGISYADDIGTARKVLEKIIADDSRILADPATKIAVSELGDSSVNFIVRPWVNAEEYWDVRFSITEQIKLQFDAAGLNIPYPQQDVHLFVEKNVV
nr:mechanosensitive ion channel [Desulfobulbaceae bacterium]